MGLFILIVLMGRSYALQLLQQLVRTTQESQLLHQLAAQALRDAVDNLMAGGGEHDRLASHEEIQGSPRPRDEVELKVLLLALDEWLITHKEHNLYHTLDRWASDVAEHWLRGKRPGDSNQVWFLGNWDCKRLRVRGGDTFYPEPQRPALERRVEELLARWGVGRPWLMEATLGCMDVYGGGWLMLGHHHVGYIPHPDSWHRGSSQSLHQAEEETFGVIQEVGDALALLARLHPEGWCKIKVEMAQEDNGDGTWNDPSYWDEGRIDDSQFVLRHYKGFGVVRFALATEKVEVVA